MASEQFIGTLAPYTPNGDKIDTHAVRVNFIASVNIDAGEWVALDTSKTGAERVQYVVLSGATPVATGDALTVGVCAVRTPAGGLCPVVIEGYVEAAKTDDTSVTAADIALVGGKTVTAQADAYEATDLTIVNGFSLGASAAGLAPVWVCRRF
jgi:hypothetical protein